MSTDQRWLSLEGICTVLQVDRDHALWLAKKGLITVIWGRYNKKYTEARFLDPTPEYANKLRMGEALYGRLYPIPRDLSLVAVLTAREVSEIMGWTLRYTQTFLWKKKVPYTKVGNYFLYSVDVIRDLLWKREGRKMAKQLAPFLVSQLITFFMAQYAKGNEEVPTDAEFTEDDLMVRKLTRMAKLPPLERAVAMKQWYEKVALAKEVAALLT